MFFVFLMTAALGGFMFGQGLRNGDDGFPLVVLGAIISVVSIIANGYIGFPA